MHVWKQTDTTFDYPHMLDAREVDFIRNGLPVLLPEWGGDIIELGCWLGGSTHLLHPYRDDWFAHHVYDNFFWANYMDAPGRKYGVHFKYGENFREEFERRITGLDVIPHQVDLTTYSFEQHLKPKFIFLDAVKTAPLACNVMPQLLSLCAPGCILMDQDLFYRTHIRLYMVHYWMTLIERGFISPILHVGSSGIFQVEVTPTLDDIADLFNIAATFPMEDFHASFALAQDLYPTA